jgi:REP element-mobilizing transposase RayT
MPRRPRLEYHGAVYHVMDRGDRGEDIFVDPEDRQRFLRTLGQACERTGWRVHSFVLMRNHYHLLLETPEPNLTRGMHWLQTTYTVRHNRRHNLHGHLFQGRYKAIPVDAEAEDYFATVSDYIHLNPVRARLLRGQQRLRDYVWSSFPVLGDAPRNRPPWLEAARVLGVHGAKDTPSGRRHFRAALEKRARKELKDTVSASAQWKPLREAWAFGSEQFRRGLRRRWTEAGKEEADLLPARHDEDEAARLLDKGLAATNPGDLRDLRRNHPVKAALAAFIKSRTTVTNRWLGEKLAMGSDSQVSRQCQRALADPEAAVWLRKLKNASGKV